MFAASTVLAHVNLKYPMGGETFQRGETVTIEWEEQIEHGDSQWNLYHSPDGGNNWETIVSGLAKENLSYNWTVPEVTTEEGQIRVVQDNSTGTDYSDVSGNFIISTTTGIQNEKNQPDNFKLNAAYPNPFNSSTVISFQLQRSTKVKVEIFNIVGQKIETLLNRELQAGTHQIKWDAANLPSGLYFYTVTTNFYSETRRLALSR